MSQQTIRPYVMALYTLQDDFRAILKAPGAEGIGKIYDPEMTIKDDGTEELKFSIPMYIRENGILKENPAWYNLEDGNLIVGMRKVKVIFGNFPDEETSPLKTVIASSVGRTMILDGVRLIPSVIPTTRAGYNPDRGGKGLLLSDGGTDLKIFEFVITKVTEEHKDGQLVCNVEAEGLAFQELGKTGYKLTFDEDTYNLDYKAHFDGIIAEVSPFYSHIGAQIDENDTTGYSLDLIFKERDSSIVEAGTDELYTYFNSIDVKLKIDTGAIIDKNKQYTLQFFCTKNCDSNITWEFNGRSHRLEETNTVENIAFSDVNLEYITITFKKNDVDVTSSIPVVSSFTLKQQEEVVANINYWMDKVVDGTDWEYSVQTDWAAYDGVIVENYGKLSKFSQDYINNDREKNNLRRMDKMYEDEYVSSWDDDINPLTYESVVEKQRVIEAQESNRYNITQTIAEKFEINCRYEYGYDNYFKIIKKKIIFFNNFIKNNSIIDITYPYDTSEVSRELDSTDIVTKMYVKSIDDDTNLSSGLISIIDSPANRSKEDYILNFDYMHDIQSITDEQYLEVEKYEREIRAMNVEMERKTKQIELYENAVAKERQNISHYDTSAVEANNRVKEANEKLRAILGEDGVQTETNFSSAVLSDSDTHFIKIFKTGIDVSTVEIYSSRQKEDSNKLTITRSEPLPDGGGMKFYITLPTDGTVSIVYASFEYSPTVYYSDIVRIYSQVFVESQTNKREAEQRLQSYREQLEANQIALINLRNSKQEKIARFERLMGPAIREGNWQDDEYKDMGNKNTVTTTESKTVQEALEDGDILYYSLDEKKFDDEIFAYVEYGATKKKMYYPYIIIEPESFTDYSNIALSFNDFWIELNQYLDNGTLNQDWVNAAPMDATTHLPDPAKMWSATHVYGVGDLCYVGTNASSRFKSVRANNIGRMPGLNDEAEYYHINSQLVPAVLNINGELKTVLLLTDMGLIKTSVVDGVMIDDWDLSRISGNARFAIVESDIAIAEDGSAKWGTKIRQWGDSLSSETVNNDGTAIIHKPAETDEIFMVYPRIKITDMLVKDGADQISIYVGPNIINNMLLTEYQDYTKLPRYAEIDSEDDEALCLSIRPIVFLNYGIDPTEAIFTTSYAISNAATSVYLDAKKVSKENAYPKVSYEVSVNAIKDGIVANLYSMLDQICHINDSDLKFQNVRGYISEIEMNLDNPWEDKITVKNYKSKFEDLFSSIVASTEQMKSNGPAYERAASCFLTTGEIREETLVKSLKSNYINYSFDSGKLTIDETNGIWATSDDGVIAIRGGGISLAKEKINGEWQWNSAITPSGINASLINAGQLNLERVFIYSGDNVAFQMNANGLYAYRKIGGDLTALEYVVHNGDGLFLVNKAGIHTPPSGPAYTLSRDINKVEISWDGLIIRNNDNEKVFYADENGNLTLAGVINATAGNIGDWLLISGGLISKDMSIGLMPNRDSGDVFWVNSENYFGVDSQGVVTATSMILDGALVADEATINGVPLTAIISQVGVGEGIFYTSLLGNTFTNDNTLKYIITKYKVGMSYDELAPLIQIQYKTGVETNEETGEEIDIYEFADVTGAFNITIEEKYLILELNNSIMNGETSKTIRFVVKDSEEIIYYTNNLELSALELPELYSVSVQCREGLIFKDASSLHATLVARVFLNGEEINGGETDTSGLTYNWYRNESEIPITSHTRQIEISEESFIDIVNYRCEVSK